MKNKLNLKTIIAVFCILAASVLASCSDWTDMESVTIKEPNIKDQNPALYAEYLADLKKYKESKHKVTYAWFDNKEKVPYSRAHRIDNVPDSIDVIVLMHPDDLVDHELVEIEAVRKDKGMTVIFSINYDDIKLAYETIQADIPPGGDEPAVDGFPTYLKDKVTHALGLVNKYGYDGISVGYIGKSTQHMTEAEKELYISYEETFVSTISAWIEANKSKSVVLEGKPQNLINKAILASCKHIIIPGTDANSGSRLSYNILMASVEGVPTDRFIVTAMTTSLDQADQRTGYWPDGSRAITSSARWAAALGDDEIVGLGVYNINNDYYNINRVYQYTREAIDIMNPSLKK